MLKTQSKTLFVGEIAPGVTKDLLYDLFSQFAPVRNVKLFRQDSSLESSNAAQNSSASSKNSNAQQSAAKQYGFVEFCNSFDASAVYIKFSMGLQLSLKGSTIAVRPSRKKDNTDCVDVGAHINIYGFGKSGKAVSNEELISAGYACLEEMLFTVLSNFDKAIYVELNEADPLAFTAVMDSFAGADKVIKSLDGQTLLGRRLTVKYCKKPNSDQHYGDAFDREMEKYLKTKR